MAEKNTKRTPPPSIQPRRTVKKAIPGSEELKNKKTTLDPKKEVKVARKEENVLQREKKERFTLWLSEDVYLAFKIHTATRKGSSSDYIEHLIKKDLGLK